MCTRNRRPKPTINEKIFFTEQQAKACHQNNPCHLFKIRVICDSTIRALSFLSELGFLGLKDDKMYNPTNPKNRIHPNSDIFPIAEL